MNSKKRGRIDVTMHKRGGGFILNIRLIELLMQSPYLISQLGDCPNIEFPTLGGETFWDTLQTVGGLRLQQNILTDYARILDENNMRKAWGTLPIMEEKLKRMSRPEFLEPGDVIGITRRRALNIYEHFAIYIGNQRVIHFAGEGDDFDKKISIHEASMGEFLKSDKDYFVLYFEEYKDTPIKIQFATDFNFDNCELISRWDMGGHKKIHIYSPEETISRARSRIGESNYNLVTNNCEHFAIWCKTGIAQSYQVKRVINVFTGSLEIVKLEKHRFC